MNDPNKGTSELVLWRLKEASLERFRIELFNAVKKLLEDFDMTWGDLAKKLDWQAYGPLGHHDMKPEELKTEIGVNELSLKELNDIAHVFSAEPYIIFRPRKPFTNS